jgi:hypothetical protein
MVAKQDDGRNRGRDARLEDESRLCLVKEKEFGRLDFLAQREDEGMRDARGESNKARCGKQSGSAN